MRIMPADAQIGRFARTLRRSVMLPPPDIRRRIWQADELAAAPRADPAQTVAVNLRQPVDVQDRMVETLRMQRIDGRVLERTPPLVRDRHGASVDRPGR